MATRIDEVNRPGQVNEAGSDSSNGKSLFDELKGLNDKLEALGVKAFGDLSEAGYK